MIIIFRVRTRKYKKITLILIFFIFLSVCVYVHGKILLFNWFNIKEL